MLSRKIIFKFKTMSNPITGITLEGFQVYDKPTFISLKRLNFLFGPNSAGKSAVQDAIELSNLLLKSKMTKQASGISGMISMLGFPDSAISDALERHWRRLPSKDTAYAPKLEITLHHTTDCTIASVIADHLGCKDPEFDPYEGIESIDLSSTWRFYELETDNENFNFQWDYELRIQSELILSSIGSDIYLNLNHLSIKDISKQSNFKSIAKDHPEHLTVENGIIIFHKCIGGFQPSGPNYENQGKRWLYFIPHGADFPSPFIEPKDFQLLREAIAEVSVLVGLIINTTQGNTNISTKVVPASRSTPSPEQLKFEVGYCDDSFINTLNKENTVYRRLAESLAEKLFAPSPRNVSGHLGELVNKSLSDHLFLDQGYSINFDYRLLLSKSNTEAAIKGYELDEHEFGFIVQLFLQDSHRRRHRIDDVGSGIGYVLPVLIEVHDGSWNASPCIIQQPELHLHPALQAALGDVFISACSEKQIIVETHSEHMMLRVLKRIRQTNDGVSIAKELKVRGEDISVLYFDPSIDGHTTVKRLRISNGGEFMDRWPHGFFAERDAELFDE
jgi:hypothetical protein